MALICRYGGECTGCMSCQDDEKKESGRCIICGRAIFEGDEAVETKQGLICEDVECLFAYACEYGDKTDGADYVSENADEFVRENKWELIDAAVSDAMDGGKEIVDRFISADKSAYAEWWLENHGLEKSVSRP